MRKNEWKGRGKGKGGEWGPTSKGSEGRAGERGGRRGKGREGEETVKAPPDVMSGYAYGHVTLQCSTMKICVSLLLPCNASHACGQCPCHHACLADVCLYCVDSRCHSY